MGDFVLMLMLAITTILVSILIGMGIAEILWGTNNTIDLYFLFKEVLSNDEKEAFRKEELLNQIMKTQFKFVSENYLNPIKLLMKTYKKLDTEEGKMDFEKRVLYPKVKELDNFILKEKIKMIEKEKEDKDFLILKDKAVTDELLKKLKKG